MIAVDRKERSSTSRSTDGIVVRELGQRKEGFPVVLKVVGVDPKILLQDAVDALGLAIGLGVEGS